MSAGLRLCMVFWVEQVGRLGRARGENAVAEFSAALVCAWAAGTGARCSDVRDFRSLVAAEQGSGSLAYARALTLGEQKG